jgi:trigger factor
VLNELAQDLPAAAPAPGHDARHVPALPRHHLDEFIDDLHEQAEERARQSLALDALADTSASRPPKRTSRTSSRRPASRMSRPRSKEFTQQGQMPAIRESIRRTKALNWLVENAPVTEVDEVAEARPRRPRTNAEADAEELQQRRRGPLAPPRGLT